MWSNLIFLSNKKKKKENLHFTIIFLYWMKYLSIDCSPRFGVKKRFGGPWVDIEDCGFWSCSIDWKWLLLSTPFRRKFHGLLYSLTFFPGKCSAELRPDETVLANDWIVWMDLIVWGHVWLIQWVTKHFPQNCSFNQLKDSKSPRLLTWFVRYFKTLSSTTST